MIPRHAVIMAGGSGTRFWPRSRRTRPKQLLSLAGGATLLEQTLQRLEPAVPRERILVVTHVDQAAAVREVTGLPAANIIGEPAGRDTAPCVALAAAVVAARNPKGAMAVLPADHLVADHEAFRRDLERAFRVAEAEDVLATFGIEPTRAATGYGWIERGRSRGDGFHEVAAFTEKPDAATARQFLAGGRHLWNSGIFVWRADCIRAEIARQLPELAAAVRRLEESPRGLLDGEALAQAWGALSPVSIDRGVMRGARRVVCLPASFDWDDVGSFEALVRSGRPDDRGNVVLGEASLLDASGCVIDNQSDGLVAMLGVEGLLVVRVDDAVLVARRDQEQRVKELVERLRAEGRGRYL